MELSKLSNLRSLIQNQRLTDLDDSEPAASTWTQNSNEYNVIRRFDFSKVREEIIHRSSGLFHVPPSWRKSMSYSMSEKVKNKLNPKLPSRPFVDHLLHLFKEEVYVISPYIDFQLFLMRTNEMYDAVGDQDINGIPPHTSPSWLVVFFATLALTAQCIQDEIILQHYSEQIEQTIPIGWDLVDAATLFFRPFTERITMDDISGTLMLALFYKQLNELGAANIWLGVSCKIAQYLGEHLLILRILIGRVPSVFARI